MLWKVFGYEKLVLLLIPTLWKVWGYEKLVLLLIPKLWKPEGITRELYISECLWQAFVEVTAILRYEPCSQFINVSQRTLHIYFIDGCRVCPLDAQYKVKNKDSDLCASAHRCPHYAYARLIARVTLNLPCCNKCNTNNFHRTSSKTSWQIKIYDVLLY